MLISRLAKSLADNTNIIETMDNLYHCEKDPGFMPIQGRCSRQLNDSKLKLKVRRHERRKTREVIRLWLGGSLADEATS